MRAIFQWNVGSRVLELGRRTLIMGVVNVTPDSFSDGGLYIDAEKAVVRAERLLDEGVSAVYTPKDFAINRIIRDVVEQVERNFSLDRGTSEASIRGSPSANP